MTIPQENGRRTTCGFEKPSLRWSTGNSLEGNLKVDNRKEIRSEATRFSQPPRRARHKLWISETRARGDLNWKSDGFPFRGWKDFSHCNDGKVEASGTRQKGGKIKSKIRRL